MSYKTFNNSPLQILHHHSLLSLVYKDKPGYWWITLRQMPYKLTLSFHLFNPLLSVYSQVCKHWAQNGKRKLSFWQFLLENNEPGYREEAWEVLLVNYAPGTAFYVELRLTFHLSCCAVPVSELRNSEWLIISGRKKGFSQHFDISFASHTYETLMMPAFSGQWFSWF